MRRAVTVALLISLHSLFGAPGCGFAVKHPAVTAGVVVGTIGLGTCELASSDHKACFGIAGGAGIAIALITAAALWLGYEDAEPAPVEDPSNLQPGPVYVPTPDQTPAPTLPAPKLPAPTPTPTPEPTPAPIEPSPPPPPGSPTTPSAAP